MNRKQLKKHSFGLFHFVAQTLSVSLFSVTVTCLERHTRIAKSVSKMNKTWRNEIERSDIYIARVNTCSSPQFTVFRSIPLILCLLRICLFTMKYNLSKTQVMYCFCYEKVRVIWTSFLDSKLTLKKNLIQEKFTTLCKLISLSDVPY